TPRNQPQSPSSSPLSNTVTAGAPPPPPPPLGGKKRSMNSAAAGGVSNEAPALLIHETSETTAELPSELPATTSNDILDDLSKLKAEVDALRGRYDAQAHASVGAGTDGRQR